MQYQELPASGIIEPGFYNSKHGRVWVTEREPEYSIDEFGNLQGHYETRYKTELSRVDGYFPSLVDVSIIIAAFEERNKERRIQDSCK